MQFGKNYKEETSQLLKVRKNIEKLLFVKNIEMRHGLTYMDGKGQFINPCRMESK